MIVASVVASLIVLLAPRKPLGSQAAASLTVIVLATAVLGTLYGLWRGGPVLLGTMIIVGALLVVLVRWSWLDEPPAEAPADQ